MGCHGAVGEPELPITTAVASGTATKAAPPRYLLATAPSGIQIHALPVDGEVILGRAAECQIVLNFALISRQHARLRILGETCVLADLDSRNGTLLRGERLHPGEERVVGYGDAFSIGAVSFLLVPPSATTATSVSGSRLQIVDVEAPTPTLDAVAQARLSVLIYGETGVGKEVLAQTLHRRSGRTGPFVAVNCAALTEPLLESELFGHERGAFTGAIAAKPGLLQAATGGTLLLDEVGEMAPALQAKLLRAIETQAILPVGSVRPVPVDVRFIAATHRKLLADVERGSFRRDLYYRLAGFAFEIPPLRERIHQLPRLAFQLLEAAASRSGGSPPALTPEATAALQAHDWPGNVRELRNVLERAVLLAAGGPIDAGHLLFDTEPPPIPSAAPAPAPAASSNADERTRIIATLDACAGNQTRAARMLGMSRTSFVHKLHLHAIPRPQKPR
jgi:DNA-binding NtrC family response regulator